MESSRIRSYQQRLNFAGPATPNELNVSGFCTSRDFAKKKAAHLARPH
jgi:hypothetical protein